MLGCRDEQTTVRAPWLVRGGRWPAGQQGKTRGPTWGMPWIYSLRTILLVPCTHAFLKKVLPKYLYCSTDSIELDRGEKLLNEQKYILPQQQGCPDLGTHLPSRFSDCSQKTCGAQPLPVSRLVIWPRHPLGGAQLLVVQEDGKGVAG